MYQLSFFKKNLSYDPKIHYSEKFSENGRIIKMVTYTLFYTCNIKI